MQDKLLWIPCPEESKVGRAAAKVKVEQLVSGACEAARKARCLGSALQMMI